MTGSWHARKVSCRSRMWRVSMIEVLGIVDQVITQIDICFAYSKVRTWLSAASSSRRNAIDHYEFNAISFSVQAVTRRHRNRHRREVSRWSRVLNTLAGRVSYRNHRDRIPRSSHLFLIGRPATPRVADDGRTSFRDRPASWRLTPGVVEISER
jgi:hypothetical protein